MFEGVRGTPEDVCSYLTPFGTERSAVGTAVRSNRPVIEGRRSDILCRVNRNEGKVIGCLIWRFHDEAPGNAYVSTLVEAFGTRFEGRFKTTINPSFLGFITTSEKSSR